MANYNEQKAVANLKSKGLIISEKEISVPEKKQLNKDIFLGNGSWGQLGYLFKYKKYSLSNDFFGCFLK